MKPITIIYTIVATPAAAKKIGAALLNEKLIACANIFPIRSIYVWQDALRDESEHAVILKTTPEKTSQTRHRLEEIHPYDTPCIMEIPVQSHEAYAAWIQDFVR